MSKTSDQTAPKHISARTGKTRHEPSRPATGTKMAQLIQMLSAKSGADVENIGSKLGWQNHTTRAAISRLKKAGYDVSSAKEGGKHTRYRITMESQPSAEAGRRARPEVKVAPKPDNAG